MKQQPDRCAKKVTGLSEAGKCTSERSLWSLGKEKQRSFFSAVVQLSTGDMHKSRITDQTHTRKQCLQRQAWCPPWGDMARNDSTSQFLNTARLNFQDYQHVRWLKPRNTNFAKKEGVQGNLAHCSTWEHKDRRKEEGKKNEKKTPNERSGTITHSCLCLPA